MSHTVAHMTPCLITPLAYTARTVTERLHKCHKLRKNVFLGQNNVCKQGSSFSDILLMCTLPILMSRKSDRSPGQLGYLNLDDIVS